VPITTKFGNGVPNWYQSWFKFYILYFSIQTLLNQLFPNLLWSLRDLNFVYLRIMQKGITVRQRGNIKKSWFMINAISAYHH
jgi:hypothetical protein